MEKVYHSRKGKALMSRLTRKNQAVNWCVFNFQKIQEIKKRSHLGTNLIGKHERGGGLESHGEKAKSIAGLARPR